MYDIHVLGSSSSGNCIYVDTGDCKFLLDVGLTMSNIKKQLHKIGVKLSSIDYAFVTHEHIDHIRGLVDVVDTYDIHTIASAGTLMLQDTSFWTTTFAEHAQKIELDGLTIYPFSVPHDSIEPLGFSILNSVGERLLYLTDCGHVPELNFKSHHVYIIEANYSLDIMENNYRSGALHFSRCQRAGSGNGHLEISETMEILEKSVGEETSHIVLSHLSSQNSNSDNFIKRVKSSFDKPSAHIAKEGLHIKYGVETNPF